MIAWHGKWLVPVVLLSALLIASGTGLQAQEGELDKSPPKDITPQEVIQRFTANEKQWKQIREQYTFRQSVKVQTLTGDEVVGEYRQVADVNYSQGKRIKNVVLGPQPSIDMTKEDFEDLETRASFTISTDELPDYNVTYAGQQKVDELHCYVFDVAPKQIVKDKRYFQGQIWVDDHDFQIVKNLFPQFTTWREQVDGKYWFPTYSSVDDTLRFRMQDVRIKQVLTFKDYKRAGTPGQSSSAQK
jgi:hypothetical protein